MASQVFAYGSIGVASLLAAMATYAEGHTMSVCTSTGGTGSTCGSLKFIMTTYHVYNEGGGTPPGTLYIKDPTGRTLTYAFSDGCTFQPPSSGGCSSDLAGYTGCGIPADADISCYYAAVSGSDKLVGVKGVETCSANGYQGYPYRAAYIADVPSATTGTYELWTRGTDQQLDPCTVAGQACKLQQNYHITIDIAVANCGTPCEPFSELSISGTTAGSNQQYTAAVGTCSANFDGAICSDISCSGGFQPSGNLKCVGGAIENNFVCVDTAFQYYCSDAVDCSAHGITSDKDNRDGCECECDAGYTGYNCGVLVLTTTKAATTTTQTTATITRTQTTTSATSTTGTTTSTTGTMTSTTGTTTSTTKTTTSTTTKTTNSTTETTTSTTETTTSTRQCTKDGEDCSSSKCCSKPGNLCYRRNERWSSCNESCTPNRRWVNGKWRDTGSEQVWDCTVLSVEHETTTSASPIAETQCTKDGEDCSSSKCCLKEGNLCYKKNEKWSSCNETCTPNRRWDHVNGIWRDTGSEQVWDCTVLSTSVSATTSTTPKLFLSRRRRRRRF